MASRVAEETERTSFMPPQKIFWMKSVNRMSQVNVMVMVYELGAYFTNGFWKIEPLHQQSEKQDDIAFKINYVLPSSSRFFWGGVGIKLCKIFMIY